MKQKVSKYDVNSKSLYQFSEKVLLCCYINEQQLTASCQHFSTSTHSSIDSTKILYAGNRLIQKPKLHSVGVELSAQLIKTPLMDGLLFDCYNLRTIYYHQIRLDQPDRPNNVKYSFPRCDNKGQFREIREINYINTFVSTRAFIFTYQCR